MSDVFTLRGPVKKERPELVKHTVERKSLAGATLGTVVLRTSVKNPMKAGGAR